MQAWKRELKSLGLKPIFRIILKMRGIVLVVINVLGRTERRMIDWWRSYNRHYGHKPLFNVAPIHLRKKRKTPVKA